MTRKNPIFWSKAHFLLLLYLYEKKMVTIVYIKYSKNIVMYTIVTKNIKNKKELKKKWAFDQNSIFWVVFECIFRFLDQKG